MVKDNQLFYIEDFEELFADVQLQHVFADQKTFPDAVPKFPVSEILEAYRIAKHTTGFNLTHFVETHFEIPQKNEHHFISDASLSPKEHINKLWDVLTKHTQDNYGTLIPLPKNFVVPGGRFRETFYWDTYFTMLGLQAAGRIELIENMVDNFAYLIDTFGFVPNGNRTYFLSRSQPPFFALMIELLSEEKGEEILIKYLPQLRKEYQFWMKGVSIVSPDHTAHEHCVLMPDGSVLNRYWDSLNMPRPEGYDIDLKIAAAAQGTTGEIFRNIRAACESGWDFSGRWMKDHKNIETINTTELIPIDLNCLLYNLETVLVKAYTLLENSQAGAWYQQQANARAASIQQYLWNNDKATYFDYNHISKQHTGVDTIASAFPLFFNMAKSAQANAVLQNIEQKFLQAGGLLTTLANTGQQWDDPNGWAPLQWIGYKAALNYKNKTLALQIKNNWTSNVEKQYKATGKMMEKYNVMDTSSTASGGEYENQDGFGWTNGVYLKMLSEDNQ